MKEKVMYLIKLVLIRIIGVFTKLRENQVLFLSEVRDEIGGNLLMMDNIISNKIYDKKYYLKDRRKHKRGFGEIVNEMKLICSSKYILLDDFCPFISFMHVKKNQEVVQLWHGPGAFKTMGLSRNDKKPSKLKKLLTHRNYTKAIVTSDEIRWCYRDAFNMDINNIKSVGFPRTDIFFDSKYKKSTKNMLLKKYPQFKGKKIIMFAPTYRGPSLNKSYYDYSQLDIDKIYEKLNKEYIFVVKMHPGLMDFDNKERFFDSLKKYPDFYYDFTSYRDINDLLLITDVLVTDYSSVIFDYLLVDKPIVYFTYDLDEYENNRGLYYPFNDYVYGLIAKNSDELIKSIKKEDMMSDKRSEFNKKFMESCDGNSTKKTYDMIFKK